MDAQTLLSVTNVCTHFHTKKGVVKALNNISFSIRKKETVCFVGESGCGKSVTALSIMRLIPDPPGKIVAGKIIFEDRDLLQVSDKEMQKIRGNKISMIFQEPMSSLNPALKIGEQISEVFTTHTDTNKKTARDKSVEMLRLVGIPAPEKRVFDYPHQLSGGMCQRVMIAMALASPNPALLIADEPTTALDVSIQAGILNLILDLKETFDMSVLFITHDMAVVSQIADRVVIMYAGLIVEENNVVDILSNPLHPYTKGLLDSIPGLEKNRNSKRLHAIKGMVPDLYELEAGCPFNSRCYMAKDICKQVLPDYKLLSDTHRVLCHFV